MNSVEVVSHQGHIPEKVSKKACSFEGEDISSLIQETCIQTLSPWKNIVRYFITPTQKLYQGNQDNGLVYSNFMLWSTAFSSFFSVCFPPPLSVLQLRAWPILLLQDWIGTPAINLLVSCCNI